MRASLFNLKNYVDKLYNNLSELVTEAKKSRANPYEIAGWIKKENPEKDILIYRITATDKYVSSLSTLEIYANDSILYSFSKREIKYISTLAILLHYKKESKYQVIWEQFRDNLHNHIIHIQDRDKPGLIKAKIDELEKNFALIDGMNSRDAYRLGKEAGIRERILEEQTMSRDR